MIKDAWQTAQLADICDSIDYGLTESAKTMPVGPKFLRITDIVTGHIDWNTVPYCEIDVESKPKYQLHHGDIVIARTGATTGYSIYIKNPPDAVFASYLVRYKTKKDFNAQYVSYFLKSSDYWEYINGVLGDKSAQPNASASTIAQVKIKYPPYPEQCDIAGILGALDDKIELNRRMNATLESMARTVFRQWFVENLEADSWEVKTLGDVLAVLETGSRPKGGVSQEPVGVPSVGAESIVKLGYFDFSKTKYVPNEFYESMRRGHIEDRDVLLYKDGGRPGEFEPHVSMFGDGFPFEKFAINEHVYRIRVNDPLSQAFLYFWLELDEIMDEMRNRGTGVAVPGLNSTALSGISISVPHKKLLNDFSYYAEPLISKIFANAKESRTLASLRDSLLPKLMRGVVRVKDVEKIL
jgi:type I restriction enzyme S subunit